MIAATFILAGLSSVYLLSIVTEATIPRFRYADPFSPAVSLFLLIAALVLCGFTVGGIALEYHLASLQPEGTTT